VQLDYRLAGITLAFGYYCYDNYYSNLILFAFNRRSIRGDCYYGIPLLLLSTYIALSHLVLRCGSDSKLKFLIRHGQLRREYI